MYTRSLKILMLALVAAFASLVALNNLTDYDSNFMYVRHVLMMDTVFPDSSLQWRSIQSETLHHVAYGIIIFTEAMIGVLCWLGAWQLFCHRSDVSEFNRAKRAGIAGLSLGLLLWFGGFLVIASEWFLMWQSKTWNAQGGAFNIVIVLALFLVYLTSPDRDSDA